MTWYHHINGSCYSADECANAVGKKATLVLTGRIVASDESRSGPFVEFQPDERFGFGDFRLCIDLDALAVQP